MFILYSNIVKDQQDSEHNVKGFHMTISPDHFTRPFHQTISPDHFTRPFHRTISPDHFTRPFQILLAGPFIRPFTPVYRYPTNMADLPNFIFA